MYTISLSFPLFSFLILIVILYVLCFFFSPIPLRECKLAGQNFLSLLVKKKNHFTELLVVLLEELALA